MGILTRPCRLRFERTFPTNLSSNRKVKYPNDHRRFLITPFFEAEKQLFKATGTPVPSSSLHDIAICICPTFGIRRRSDSRLSLLNASTVNVLGRSLYGAPNRRRVELMRVGRMENY